MYYTISEVAQMSGLSTRTLRYYDEIGLLRPTKNQDNDYRLYRSKDLERLQTIMFLKEMALSLEKINYLIQNKEVNLSKILKEQRFRIVAQVRKYQVILNLLDDTIKHYEEGNEMPDNEKFNAFKREKIKENEVLYGEELKEKYTEADIKAANEHFSHLTEMEYQTAQGQEKIIKEGLQLLISDNVALHQLKDNQEAKKVFDAHKTWLKIMSGRYSKDYHQAMADLYVSDERFYLYYQNLIGQAQATSYLSHIIKLFVK